MHWGTGDNDEECASCWGEVPPSGLAYGVATPALERKRFGKEKMSVQERGTDYASMASIIREYPVGNFSGV